MIKALEKLKESNIDFVFNSCGRAIYVAIGKHDKGLEHQKNCNTLEDARIWLYQTVFEEYPESEFTKYFDNAQYDCTNEVVLG